MAASKVIAALSARESSSPPTPTDGASELLDLLKNPFGSQIQLNSIWASLGTSVGITVGIALAFSFLRPYNNVVYAPKVKHADEKHAPPPLSKGLFAWVAPLWNTKEQDLIQLVGVDATIFMRFARMCRNIFLVLSVIGCGILIPVNVALNSDNTGKQSWLYAIGPLNVSGGPHWANVVVVWLIDIVICGFLWWNYRKILQLRRQYFDSEEYQTSLHARTLMLHDIPKNLASDEGISKIIDSVAPSSSFARTAVARNVKILPELIQEHEKTVRQLEKVLAKYLKDPQNLPPARPLIKPSTHDRSYETYPKGQKVDAIEYLTQRIKELEIEIKEVRLSVDKRSSMPYGFASYDDISETHAIAFACKKKKPLGAIVNLAPRPHDIIWDNMPLSSGSRSRRRMFNNLWIALLTLIWIAPNAMIAIFLVNLTNLGLVWPAFQVSLEANTAWWSVVQGVASPALTSLIYLLLPILFRRMSIRAGDLTKTGRERHVLAKLYTFFVFNNLFAFSVFSGIWTFVATVVDTANKTQNGVTTSVWEAIVKANFGQTVFQTLCHISPFFVTWLLQRQLGAAVDLAQLWTLFYSFIMRKFSNPTPRELIELTAPQPFDYASYYNYFLFYATVTLCYSYVQPLVLPAAALYFCIDVPLKKYLIMYIFVTKTESGGMFWRVLFNRFLFGTILSNLVVFLVVWVRGTEGHLQAYCVAPLPFLLIGFKFYCAKAFDNKYYYYSTRPVAGRHVEGNLPIKEQANLRGDRLVMRFGNPALYKPLITPMVHAKAQNILASVYQGRLSDGREAGSGDTFSTSGYSDTYALDAMAAGKVGKSKSSRGAVPGFELVPENRLDFEYYKNRNEFAEDHGAGELFGRTEDQVRPGTPGSSTVMGDSSRPGTPQGWMGFGRGRRGPGESSLGSNGVGTTYAAGYASPSQQYQSQYPGQPTYTASPPLMPVDAASRSGSVGPGARSNFYGQGGNDSGSNLVNNAQAMPVSPPPVSSPSEHPGSRGQSRDRYGAPRAPGMLGGGPYGYGGLPQADEDDPGSYDYFRGSANTRTPGAGTGGAQRRETSDTYRSASGGGGYRGVGSGGQGYRG